MGFGNRICEGKPLFFHYEARRPEDGPARLHLLGRDDDWDAQFRLSF